MGWHRGFHLGLVAGGLGVLVLAGVLFSFLVAGSYFQKAESKEVESKKVVKVEEELLYGTECFDHDEINDTWEKIGCWNKEEKEARKKQREKESEEYRLQFEENKRKWLKENPPVDFLFDANRIMDKDYVLNYLEQFPISGDCSLVWIQDVICWNGGLVFPTERPTH